MAASKRERDYQRRRYEKYQERLAKRQAARRRRIVVALAALALVVIGLVLLLVLSPWENSTDDGATPVTGDTVPDAALAEGRTWTATMATSAGTITMELDGAAAPQAVANFVTLAQDGYFDDTSCHRLTTEGIFVLQCGDPTGTGSGGPDYRFGPVENAPADDVYPAGTVAMARVGNNAESMGSQFFLVYEDSVIDADTAGGYTVFGHITSGLDVVRAVADGGTVEGGIAPVIPVTIEGVEVE